MNIYMRNWKEKLKKVLCADKEVIMTELYGPLYSSTTGTIELATQVFGTEVYILASSLFRCKSIKLDTHEDEKAFRFICENTQPPGFLATDSCEIDRASFCEKQTWFKSNGIKTGLSDRTFLLDEWQKAGGVLYVDSEIDIDINAFREIIRIAKDNKDCTVVFSPKTSLPDVAATYNMVAFMRSRPSESESKAFFVSVG